MSAADEAIELARAATDACEERLRADAALAGDPDAQRRLGSAIGLLASATLLREEVERCTDPILASAVECEVVRLARAAVGTLLTGADDEIRAAGHALLDLDAGPERRDGDELLRELARRRFAAG